MSDVPGYLLSEVSHFFDIYKQLEPGKDTDVRGWQDRAVAEQEITAASARAARPAHGSSAAHAAAPDAGTARGQVHSFRNRAGSSRRGHKDRR